MRIIHRDWDRGAYHRRVVHRGQMPGIGQWDDVRFLVRRVSMPPPCRRQVVSLAAADLRVKDNLVHRY